MEAKVVIVVGEVGYRGGGYYNGGGFVVGGIIGNCGDSNDRAFHFGVGTLSR